MLWDVTVTFRVRADNQYNADEQARLSLDGMRVAYMAGEAIIDSIALATERGGTYYARDTGYTPKLPRKEEISV
jgi:hypothetical protein